MLPTASQIDNLIADIWQRFPAPHRLNLDLDGTQIVLYSNCRSAIHALGCYFCDSVAMTGHARILLSIIDLDLAKEEDRQLHRELNVLAQTTTVAQVTNDGPLITITADPRFVIAGECRQYDLNVIDFIERIAAQAPVPVGC
jgi:hypothetical protein